MILNKKSSSLIAALPAADQIVNERLNIFQLIPQSSPFPA
ncbi:hypothetical protein HMPREF9530_00526 [Escherichia coli MS 21-1]|nr:hypothetical protein HMPREF9530_00526 [Escherichia coli MS 21-1]ESA88783.1 hypothetical protein HMPREF1599_02702 [Escherichia coli 907713]KEN71089.1 hypothetical protein AD40_1585 [Escherichia coli 1-392-07_S4_C3]KEO02251.1 hypothetical protein AC84_1515 [Escherichia coli 1-392-07_S4_C1]CCP99727.1 hypothetical protein ECK4_1160 [Escherichia coli O5:K4(L):H4 str. ATCC 23502]